MMLSRFLTPREQLFLLGATLALTVGAVSLYMHDRFEARDSTTSKESVLEPKALPSEPINLNTASQEELEALPGIGPKLAAAIIRYRTSTPFQSVDEVTKVPGIGPKRRDALRPFAIVSP